MQVKGRAQKTHTADASIKPLAASCLPLHQHLGLTTWRPHGDHMAPHMYTHAHYFAGTQTAEVKGRTA